MIYKKYVVKIDIHIKSSCNILWKKEEDMMGKDIKKTLVKAWNYKWIYLMLFACRCLFSGIPICADVRDYHCV